MKALKIIGYIFLTLFAFFLIGIGSFIISNLHWYDKYERALKKSKAVEKQAFLPNGNIINYGEVENNNPPLLLIHGQGGAWQDYALLFPKLKKNWHVFSIDVYGHGKSSHNKSFYYIDKNADDLIWFIENVIGEPTVVSGHSNGALTTAYIAAYGGKNILYAILEDPPVFSTEGEDWEKHFSYLDTFKTIHEYQLTDKSECWASYYFRNCYWGKLYMDGNTEWLANAAQSYHEKHPDEYVKIPYMPSSLWYIFKYYEDFDFDYAENFYDLSWNNGYSHKQILSDIQVPCIYLHAKEGFSSEGGLICAASREQAERAVSYIKTQCELIETPTSDHTIHTKYPDIYLNAVNSFGVKK